MNYTYLGIIKKTFGNKGELLFQLRNADCEIQMKEGSWIFIDIDSEFVPFQIETFNERNDDSFIAKLKDITIEKANKYTGLTFHIPTEEFTSQASKGIPKTITGFEVTDKTFGSIGIIEDVIYKTGQDLLQVKFKDKQILIPVNENIILKVDHKKKLVSIDAPDGLIDMYLNS